MKATARLHELGQSLWLDNITRTMLGDGTLRGYIDELSVTGLTSNPTIFDKAISGGDAYDAQIAELSGSAGAGEGPGANADEDVFFELALADLRDATDLFAAVHERTDGVDGFCSLEVSPLLADDAEATIAQAAALHAKAGRENLFIKIPGTEAGLQGDRGVDLRRGADQRHPALRRQAVPRRRRGLHARHRAPDRGRARPRRRLRRFDLHEPLGRGRRRAGPRGAARTGSASPSAVAPTAPTASCSTPTAGCGLMNEGARAQRLLWASTGTKDPDASDTLYIEAFASPFTVNTMPEPTLKAFADHGEVGDLMDADGGNSEQVLKEFEAAGIDVAALGEPAPGGGQSRASTSPGKSC